ncbi:unnamed protein product [Arabis nemorensis]|uniref:RNase H type-1 domain-containing protein n=1 Tax=Arabis nemorensis TaxID=586526 RepID=A0A565B4R9_9BRAS|nr:unnamed protein product [Arabis nemorensis]
MEDAKEWEKREESTKKEMTPNTGPQKRWIPPPLGWLKCNVDGAKPQEGSQCGLGWMLRNEKGTALWMGARAIPRTRTIIETETEALRWAMSIVNGFGYQNVIYESDS